MIVLFVNNQKSTPVSGEHTVMGAAILRLAVCACDALNKAGQPMGGSNVHYVMSQCTPRHESMYTTS